MTFKNILGSLAASFVLLAGGAFAHHSFTAEFDGDKPKSLTVTGSRRLLSLELGESLQVWDALAGEQLANFSGDGAFGAAHFHLEGEQLMVIATDRRGEHTLTLEGFA